MGALGKLKKMGGRQKEDEIKIVQIDFNNISEDDSKWDIGSRENQEKIAEKEAAFTELETPAEISEDVFVDAIAADDIVVEHIEDKKHVIDGYGIISEIPDSIMGNTLELIKVLDRARDREQWLYILDNALADAFDITLVDYLFDNNYTIEEYKLNSCVTKSVVKKQSSIFYRFLKQVLAEKDDDKLIDLLSSVSFIDDRIIEIVVNNKYRNTIIKENTLLRFDEEKKLFNALVDYEAKREEKDFSFLDYLVLTDLNQADMDKLLDSGYVIDIDSPEIITNNNELIRKLFLKDYDQDIINLLLTKANNRPGFCFKIYNFHNKKVLTKDFMKVIGMRDFLKIIKYIEIPGIVVNFDRIIEEGYLENFKTLYRELNRSKLFNRQLMIDLINLYETNTSLLTSLFEVEDVTEYEEQLYLLFNIDDKSHINSLEELEDIQNHIYNMETTIIDKNKDPLVFKDCICRDLIGEHYLNIHKMLIELLGSERLIELRRNIIDENKKKCVDKYINLSLFLEELVDCDNINVLKNVVKTVGECTNKSMLWNRDITDIGIEVMALYTYEINEKLTGFSKYLSNKIFNIDNKISGYVNIPSNNEFNLLTYKVPYYGIESNLRCIKNPCFGDVTYQSLNGISDEYGRLVISNGEVVVLYNKLPDESLLFMSDHEMGVTALDDSLSFKTSTQINAMPYRKLVRETKQLVTNSYNEFVVLKDLMKPAGILVFDIPTQEQINAAAYLEVPLVNIEQITQNIVKYDNGIIDVNYINIKYEEIIDEEITHDNENNQFLELFDSLLEIKGKSNKLVEAIYEDGEYTVLDNEKTKVVIPIFKENDYLDCSIDINTIEEDKIKSNIFKRLLPEASINYEIKKYKVDDESILCVSYDKIDYEELDVSLYDITTYLKKMAICYLLGDPYDADTYCIQQEVRSSDVQLYEDIDLVSEYLDEMEEISEVFVDDTITIDFIELIDYIGKIDAMDDDKYLEIFKDYINVHNKVSINYLKDALLDKKHTLVQKMGNVIEYFTKAKEEVEIEEE